MRTIYIPIFFLLVLFTSLSAQDITLNDVEYFEKPGLNVMLFQDYYPEGHQGGLTVILNGERLAADGDVRLEPTPGQWQLIPKLRERFVDKEKQTIRVTLSYPDSARDRKGFNPIEYPDLQFSYHISVKPRGSSFLVSVDLDEPLPEEWIGKVGFNLELFPGLLFGKSFQMDDQFGLFPRQLNGPLVRDEDGVYQVEPLAVGKKLIIAPEAPEVKMEIKSEQELQLIDGRAQHNNGWFIVRTPIPAGVSAHAIEWLVTPNALPGWRSAPVVHVSQVGYFPAQQKVAVIEQDKNDDRRMPAVLQRSNKNGEFETVLQAMPKAWGRFLRYQYSTFDFSDVATPGLYLIKYGDSKSEPFQISATIYERHVWQPTLEYFLPVQMCHMLVRDRYRVWHGLCHMDDALMAPTNWNHFDGYKQGDSTLTKFAPGEPVPGLNQGGWHDAGDYDLRVESQAGTVYILSLAYELFHVRYDETTVDQKEHVVELHKPDGIPDMVQQIEHGVLTILGGYDALGRLYRGIICPTLAQYVLLGDGSAMTDNLVYDPALKEDERKGDRSGKKDDRWVFTEKNPRRAMGVIPALAAASRVLQESNADLSRQCLEAAEALWRVDQSRPNSGKVNAAAELFLTTSEDVYKNYIIENVSSITRRIERSSMVIGRLMQAIDDKDFQAAIIKAVQSYKKSVDTQQKENPFGVPYRPNIWGDGWGIQRFGVNQYFLHKSFPDIFPKESMLNALNFILGCHPGENRASFASGVGSRSVTVAYGVNRAGWSYIPGGVVSGTGIIRPDFAELKEWPFFWQQTEYVLGGGASNFMFLVLAARDILSQ